MTALLFVCLGNICRSPTAEGIFRARATARGLSGLTIDSAGTGDWHIGHPPDRRAVTAARTRGIDITGLRARQVETKDFFAFDMILAMDRANFEALDALAPAGHRNAVKMMLDFTPGPEREVPDPYFGGPEGFERVLDLLEAASDGLINHLLAR